jgi:hypothetical protein
MTPILATVSMWGFAQFAVVLAIVGVVAGAIFSSTFRSTLKIWFSKGNARATSAIDRELQAIRDQEAIVNGAALKASDLRGKLNSARNTQKAADAAVDSAKSDLKLAKTMATTRIKATNAGISDTDLNAALASDAIVLGQAQNLKNKLTSQATHNGVVTTLEKTVNMTRQAVDDAKAKVVELQLTAQSDQAKAAAALVITDAAEVLGSFKGLDSVGAVADKAHKEVDEQFEAANARLEDAQGPQAQRDFDAAKRAAGLGDLINES